MIKIKKYRYIEMPIPNAPNGYKLVRLGVRGRLPVMEYMSLDDMTPQQRKDFKYRQKTKEKRLKYQREYYQRKKAEKTS